jgi:hypothetical protein
VWKKLDPAEPATASQKMPEIRPTEKAVAYLIDFLDSFGCNTRLVESVVYHESRLCGK